MKCIVGSASARKIQITEKVLNELFVPGDRLEVTGVAAVSGVPETPYDKETFDGARNRAMSARAIGGACAYAIGIESGLVERYGHVYEEAWCAAIDDKGNEFYGFSSGLKVPDFILKKMDDQKLEHSHVMEQLEHEFHLTNSDTWGNYSGGVVSREVSLEEAIRNTFVQIVAPENGFYRK